MPTLRLVSRLLPAVIAVLALARAPQAQQLVDSPYLNGLPQPVAFAFHDDHVMYICDRFGTVRIFDHGVLLPTPLLDISEEVGAWRDFGMLGFALDPDFDNNGYYYVSYIVDRHYLLHYGTPSYNAGWDEPFAATIVRVTRFTADAATGFTTTVPGSRHVLFGETPSTGAPSLHESHGGGQLLFGRDGTLLVAIGDGAHYHLGGDYGNDPLTYCTQALADGILRPEENVGVWRAQMLTSCSGKILRLDPATGDGVPSNPFYDAAQPRSARSRIYALGFRNPFRMSIRPGTGSTDPALGRPGVIYLGDVGWFTHEELDVITEPGQNFGWPLFEGITSCWPYDLTMVDNPEAPNPLAGTGGCNIPFFRFQDLLHQAVSGHTEFFPNPCDPSVPIPPSTPTFVHTLPVLDWHHAWDYECRVPKFENGVLVARQLGTPESGIPGPQFHGGASVGGCWHSGLSFPTSFGPCYYHADFGIGWIKRFEFDAQDHLLAVHDFTSTVYPLMLGEDPSDHSLLYVTLTGDQFRALRFGVEPPPVARPTASITPAQGSVDVQLDARTSSDPEGQPLTYLWQLGNGRTSTAPQLGISLRSTGAAASYPLQLTVTDINGATGTATLPIAVDNTAPHVAITSFENGALYSQTTPTLLPLHADVHDDEQGAQQLTWSWRTTLHHRAHVHPEPADPLPVTTTTLSPTSAGAEFFAYSVDLTVTDPLGLATTVRHWLFPDTSAASTAVLLTAPTNGARIEAGTAVQFSALTTGNVQRVEYYVEGTLVGAATTPPYAYSWTPTTGGAQMALALAIAADGTSSNTRGTTFTVEVPQVSKARVRASVDDGSEALGPTGAPSTRNQLLALGDDGTPSLTGMMFTLPTVPVGARLRSATLEFTAAQADAGKAHFTIACDANVTPRPIGTSVRDLQGRKSKGSVAWSPGDWVAGASAAEQRSPDLTPILQPLVGSPRWSHQVVVLLRGFGVRHALAWDGDRLVAPLLTVEWLPPLPSQHEQPASGDGDENLGAGSVDLAANTLLLGSSGGAPKLVALQFPLALPANALVESAQLQFTSAGADSGPAVLTIRIEAVDDALPLANAPFDLSARQLAPLGAIWYPPEWPTPGQRTADQRTCDLGAVLQQVLSRPGWNTGQTVTLLIEGTGARTAAAADAGSVDAPRLEIRWRTP